MLGDLADAVRDLLREGVESRAAPADVNDG